MTSFTRAVLAAAGLLLVAAAFAACGGGTPSSTDSGEGESTDQAVAAVDRYITAITDGDLEAAWDLVDERSREAIGGYGDFASLESALAEGIGAWSGAEDRKAFVGSVGAFDGATVWSVTLLGIVAQEGPPALAATSVLTRIGPDGVTVSPFEDPFGDLGFPAFDPADGSEVTADDTVIIGLPVGLEPILIAIDGDPVRTEPLLQPDADGDTISYVLAGLGVEPGRHALTVVMAADDGAMDSIAFAYTVTEGPSGGDDGAGAAEPGSPMEVAQAVEAEVPALVVDIL